jgi:hypothetical protein
MLVVVSGTSPAVRRAGGAAITAASDRNAAIVAGTIANRNVRVTIEERSQCALERALTSAGLKISWVGRTDAATNALKCKA